METTCAAAIKRKRNKAVIALNPPAAVQLEPLNKTLLMLSDKCKFKNESDDKLAHPCNAVGVGIWIFVLNLGDFRL